MYCTVEQANKYFADFYGVDNEWDYVDEDEKLSLLNRVALAIDGRFGQSFLGDIFDPIQDYLFPRTAFTDGNGRPIPEGIIPTSLTRATAELALMASQDVDIFGSDNRTGIQSETVSVGSVSTSTAYTGSGSFSDETGHIATLLDPLLLSTGGFSFGSSSRG